MDYTLDPCHLPHLIIWDHKMKTPHALSGILEINYESPVPSASHKFHQINRKNNPLSHHLSITEYMLHLM